VAVVAGQALSVVAAEADISHDPEQVVFPTAYPVVLTYAEVEEGNQVGNFLAVAHTVVQ
jgi:hypothetical protein